MRKTAFIKALWDQIRSRLVYPWMHFNWGKFCWATL